MVSAHHSPSYSWSRVLNWPHPWTLPCIHGRGTILSIHLMRVENGGCIWHYVITHQTDVFQLQNGWQRIFSWITRNIVSFLGFNGISRTKRQCSMEGSIATFAKYCNRSNTIYYAYQHSPVSKYMIMQFIISSILSYTSPLTPLLISREGQEWGQFKGRVR